MGREEVVQTRLPEPYATRLDARVKREGVSLAFWLRRLIIKELDQVINDCWIVETGSKQAADPLSLTLSGPKPDHKLRRLEDTPRGTRYKLLYVQHGSYVGEPDRTGIEVGINFAVTSYPWFREQKKHRVVLRGSATAQEILSSEADQEGHVILELAPEKVAAA